MRPNGPVGKPVPVTLAHVSPPSVDFHNALPGLLSDPEREQTAKARLIQISAE